jgi:Ca2+-binding RTX toxin-like protein
MLRYLPALSSIFSPKTPWTSRSKASNKLQCVYQNLEARRVLAGISFDASTGFVTIAGSAGNDFSYVTASSVSQIQVSLTGFTAQTFNTSEVNRIFFYGLDGDDFFQNETSIACEAYGGEGNDELYGGEGDDRLAGGPGNDLLKGGGGNDKLFGISGFNQIYGGDGDDELWGGTNNDSLYGEGGNDFINTGGGTNFADGGDGDDIIFSGAAISNFLIGGNGDDYIVGGNGNDRIEGGAGNDRLFGGAGDDNIFGGDDDDFLRGGIGHDFIDGGEGNDTIFGDTGNDEIIGANGNDRLFGGPGNDRILGNAGNDEISGGAGDDELYGGDGDDIIYGGDGDDVVRAGAGNDFVYGQAGNDELFGQDGDDLLNGGSGDDILHGQEGNDRLIGGAGNDRLYGGNGNDFLSAGDGNNSLFGGVHGTNRLVGGSGNNRFLLADSAINEVFSFKTGVDVRIVFRNGLDFWTNTEIRVVDDSLHDMHLRSGNTRALRATLTDRPLVFIKDKTLASLRYGTNELATITITTVNPVTGLPRTITYQEQQIRLPDWDEFNESTNLMVRAEVAREIAYNWASEETMANVHLSLSGIFPRFADYSGWTSVSPPEPLLPEYLKSLDNQWWYFKNATFTENFARYNPAADFASVWKFYFDPRVTQAQRDAFFDKLEFIDELFSKLATI